MSENQMDSSRLDFHPVKTTEISLWSWILLVR